MDDKLKEILDGLLEALEGVHEPRRLRITHTDGDSGDSTVIEVSNFEADEVDNETDQNEQ